MKNALQTGWNQERAWVVAAVGALVVMAGLGFGRFSYTMLLPATRQGLRLSYAAAGLLATANLAGYLLGSLTSGAIAHRIGVRGATVWGLVMLAVGLGWMGAARGEMDAAAARAMAGIAGAIVYVQVLGLVAVWFPGRARGLASGIMHAGNGAGLILTGLGLPLVLMVAPGQGWRTGWSALALASLAIVPIAWLYCRFPPRAGQGSNPAPQPAPQGSGFRAMMRDPRLAIYGGLYGLFGLSYIIYATFFAETLRVRGLALIQIGIVWALVGTLSLASGPLWGSLSDRVGRTAGLAVLFALQTIAYVAFLNPASWSLMLSVLIFGVTAWGIPAIMAAAMGDVGHTEDAATAFGVVTTVMGIGQAVGPALAGLLADATGVASSGLWVSALAAGTGGLWSLRRIGRR